LAGPLGCRNSSPTKASRISDHGELSLDLDVLRDLRLYLCGSLSDLFGRRYVIRGFVLPASILLVVLGYLDNPTSLFWVGLVLNFLITGSFGAGLGYNTELFPTQIRGTAVGTAFTFGTAAAASAPAIVGWIATSYSIAAALPLLALSFFLLVPMFLFVARETTRKELADFVGQRL